MIYDLPVIMVSIARRFYYQSLRLPGDVPEDHLSMQLHDPMLHPMTEVYGPRSLGFYSRSDAPLAPLERAFKLYEIPRERIVYHREDMSDEFGWCNNWEGPAQSFLYKVIHEDMIEDDGGVNPAT